MKNLLLFSLVALCFIPAYNLNAQCNALFEWEQVPGTLNVHFIDHSTSEHDITVWNWNFGDGQTSTDHSPTHHYSEPGTYEVCLMIHDNHDCNSTICHEVVVAAVAGCHAAFTFDVNQDTHTAHFFDQSTSEHDIVSWQWNFGDGQTSDLHNPTHVYNAPGVYLVCLIITDGVGCTSDICHEVTIEGDPDHCEAGFEIEETDDPFTFNFLDASTSDHQIVEWHWDFGDDHTSTDQDPSHTYDSPGTYEVCLVIVSETGCEDSYCHHVVVSDGGDECHAAFTFEPGDNPLNIHFFDQSTSDHDIVSWVWHFGDGQNGDGQNPIHLYAQPGTYNVCLIITSATGCVADHCMTIVVEGEGDHCEAAFTFEPGDNPLVIHFFNQSTSDHDIVSHVWHFGDGESSDLANPVHTYSQPGNYNVCLVITSETGCVDEFCMVIEVGEGGGDECHAEFAFEPGDNPLVIHFFNQSTSDHGIVSYVWHFGDGSTGDGQNPVHTYDHAGVYNVCLVITSETGCVSEHCEMIEVGGNGNACEASFTIEGTSNPCEFHFIDHSSSNHDIISWAWNFGDGQTSTVQSPSHVFANPGTYVVCLIITDNTGCVADRCHEVHACTEEAECVANYTIEETDNPFTFHFVDHSTSQHNIILWHWNFHDGSPIDTNQNPTHTFPHNGTYEVCLTTLDDAGCEAHYCHALVINHEPCHAMFYWIVNHDTDSLEFHNTSTHGTDHTVYLWDFGDGNTSNEINPQHEYTENGVYTICLIMTDTTTNCSSDVCHVYVQEENDDAQNDEQEDEEQQFFTSDTPVFRYTNPTSDELTLSYHVTEAGKTTLDLYDLTGFRIYTHDLGYAETGQYVKTIQLPDLKAGVYTIVMRVGAERITKNLIIVRE